jgi:NTE family protein
LNTQAQSCDPHRLPVPHVAHGLGLLVKPSTATSGAGVGAARHKDVNRVAQGMRAPNGRKRIGLALSGGVARGAAHIGVLKVLEREGIPIECVAGTSAGSLTGALYCAGIRPAQMEELIAHFGWRQIASPAFPRRGFFSFAKLERWLIETIGDLEFADLGCPFAAVAADLKSGEPVILREGRVAPAVHASCAVPGFAVPVELKGRWLCDGGVSVNLPSAAARALGADYIVGVDLFQHHIRAGWGPFGFGLAALENLIRRSGGGLEQADCVITPKLAGDLYLGFGKYKELISEGEVAAEAQLSTLRAALAENAAAI